MKATSFLLLILTATILFLGGWGPEKQLVELFAIGLGILLLAYVLLVKKRIFFPKGFLWYLVFLFLALLSFFWSKDPKAGQEYILLFSSGALFWLSFYNLKDEVKNAFLWLVFGLGISFAFSYGVYLLKKDIWRVSYSLIAPYTDTHHHLGDFWALVSILLFYEILKERKWWKILALASSLIILVFSLSRSAYVSVLVGFLWLFVKKKRKEKLKKFVMPVIIIVISFFLFASLFKTTLYSRVYFIEGVMGFIKNPIGIGLGNFSIISSGTKFYSTLAHNIFLEVLIGMGILGLTFVIWFLVVSYNMWRSREKELLVYQALFFALSANFFFDTTYVIPTMLWLWFIFCGFALKTDDG